MAYRQIVNRYHASMEAYHVAMADRAKGRANLSKARKHYAQAAYHALPLSEQRFDDYEQRAANLAGMVRSPPKVVRRGDALMYDMRR